jgi:hypothetical protein
MRSVSPVEPGRSDVNHSRDLPRTIPAPRSMVAPCDGPGASHPYSRENVALRRLIADDNIGFLDVARTLLVRAGDGGDGRPSDSDVAESAPSPSGRRRPPAGPLASWPRAAPFRMAGGAHPRRP